MTDAPLADMTAMQAMASLFRKKVAVLKALSGGLEKGGTNTFHKYQYVEASDVKHAVGLALINAGLALQMSVIESRHITVPGKSGDALILQVQFSITLCDIDTGATETSSWLGEAGLTGQDDKAANKAATAALKYYLLSNFLIGDKEEDERDADRGGQTPRPSHDNQRKPAPSNQRPARSPSPHAAEATRDQLRDEFQDRQIVEGFVSHWTERGASVKDIISALKVDKWSQWTLGLAAAHQAMRAYLGDTPSPDMLAS